MRMYECVLALSLHDEKLGRSSSICRESNKSYESLGVEQVPWVCNHVVQRNYVPPSFDDAFLHKAECGGGHMRVKCARFSHS